MSVSEAQKRATTKYHKAQDNIMVRTDKEHGARIRQAAADAGLSVQKFVLMAVDNWIARNNPTPLE